MDGIKPDCWQKQNGVAAYLSSQPPVEPASDHASGVGLDNYDGLQSASKSPAHEEAPAATLEVCDSLTGHVIRCTQLPGTDQGLKAREANAHLKGHHQKQELR